MLNVAAGLEGGLPYRPSARAAAETRQADKPKGVPSSRCLPLGPVLAHTYLEPRKIVQIPDPLVILNERVWTVTIHQSLMVDTELLEFVCLENETDVSHLVWK
jgi:hypothetical protein